MAQTSIHYDVMTFPPPIPAHECAQIPTLLGCRFERPGDAIADWPDDWSVCVLCPNAFNLGGLRTTTCDSLGTVTSAQMDVLGATMLHEFMHWEFMTVPLIGYPIYDWNRVLYNPGAYPANAYGAFNCAEINRLSLQPASRGKIVPNPMQNTDSFVYFALETYWRKKCGVDFSPAVAPDPPGPMHPATKKRAVPILIAPEIETSLNRSQVLARHVSSSMSPDSLHHIDKELGCNTPDASETESLANHSDKMAEDALPSTDPTILRESGSEAASSKHSTSGVTFSEMQDSFAPNHSKRAYPDNSYFLPNHCDIGNRASRAFFDALRLAAKALVYDIGGPAFQCYFQPGQEDLVRRVFLAWFNPQDDTPASTRFQDAEMRYSYMPGNPGPDLCVTDPLVDAYLVQSGPGYDIGAAGIMVWCDRAYDLVDLDDITCEDLDAYASDRMENLGMTVLHEYIHWSQLGAAITGAFIPDWNNVGAPGQTPPDGYGPYNAWKINQFSALPNVPGNLGRPNPVENVDNYVWYALEAFFSFKCGQDFGDPLPQPILPHPN